MEDGVRRKHPWMKVPLVIDSEIGARWDGSVNVEEIGSDYLHLKGRKKFYDELVLHIQIVNPGVKQEIVKIWEEPYVEQVILRKSYEGDYGGDTMIEAFVRL